MKSLDKEKLIKEVRNKGIEIDNIVELKKINLKYRDLVPILLEHLVKVDDENDKEFLVRCLGVKGFVEASKTLIAEFYKSNNLTFKWAIGNTLSIIQDESVVNELIKIAKEKEHGIARQMIIDGLGSYKDENVKTALIELLNDEEVMGHAISGLSRMGDKSLIKYIEPFLNFKVKWIRKEAEKAIKKLNK
jgi:hypothetical protein